MGRRGKLKMEVNARTIFRVRKKLTLVYNSAHLLVDLICLRILDALILRSCVRVVS